MCLYDITFPKNVKEAIKTNLGVPDTDWKRNPDIVAEESYRARYSRNDEDDDKEDEDDCLRD